MCVNLICTVWTVGVAGWGGCISDGMPKLNILNSAAFEWDVLRAPKQSGVFARSLSHFQMQAPKSRHGPAPPLRNMQMRLHRLI